MKQQKLLKMMTDTVRRVKLACKNKGKEIVALNASKVIVKGKIAGVCYGDSQVVLLDTTGNISGFSKKSFSVDHFIIFDEFYECKNIYPIVIDNQQLKDI